LREEALDKTLQLMKGEVQAPYQTQRITKERQVVEVLMTATALVDETGRIYAVSTSERLAQAVG